MPKTKNTTSTLSDAELLRRVEEEYQAALDFRQSRVADWHANEDLLYGKKPKVLTKRSNIMVKLASGFEDTLLAKIKNPPVITFKPTEEGDALKAKKVTALWELESSVANADWEYKDILTKKLAVTSGRAIFKVYATAKPYKHHLDIVDHYDFLIDPMAGGVSIESARYLGQDNIFKTKYEIENDKRYDKDAVASLVAGYTSDGTTQTTIDVDNQYHEKANRFAVLGMDIDRYNLQKDGIFKLLEWYTTIQGVRWYVLCSLDKKVILRKAPLAEIIDPEEGSDVSLFPFESWAYYPDAFNFWSPAPLDHVRELFLLRNIAVNQIIDNNEAKNKPMKSYDPNTYNHPEKLEYRPDGLVPTKAGTDPSKGIYIHPTPDIYDPKSLSDILEDLAAKITGVTPAGQGVADSNQKVGIYYGDQQEVAGRMSMFELSYTRCQINMAKKYLLGVKQFLDEPQAIKMIGLDGINWDTISKGELSEFDITFTGGVTQAKNDAIKAKAKIDFITNMMANPTAGQLINPKFAVEQGALAAGFSPEDAKRMLDKEDVNEAINVRAIEDIQKLLSGQSFRPYLKADTIYMQKIFDFMYENDLAPEVEAKLAAYLEEIQPIVVQNMVLRARRELAVKGTLPTPESVAQPMDPNGMNPDNQVAAANGAAPLPGGPDTMVGADNARASMMTNEMKQNYPNA